ncbi:chemosensory receptor a [Plakobranchus ocellatus]|uniref:Chemosensory receptor a n=1 Tax=Plakobranchus ocellatus TaxID=259542 RepID=A0AAV3YFE8_9GAST|nr:chemosensory receptor a [Plakobranchus ocellatus]
MNDSAISMDIFNQTTSTNEVQERLNGLVPFGLYVNLVQTIACFDFLVAPFGMVTNTINLKIFLTTGGISADGVTLTFIMLALSDLGVCVFSWLWSVSAFFFVLEKRFQDTSQTSLHFVVQPRVIGYHAASGMNVFTITTTLITIYLAVMRCLSVARPLTFRGSLSPRKTGLLFAAFLVFGLGTRLAMLSQREARGMYNPRSNVGKPSILNSRNWKDITNPISAAIDLPFPFVAEVTLTACFIVMTRALKASSEFRGKTVPESNTKSRGNRGNQRANLQQHRETHQIGSEGKLSAKDARVIKQLLIICLIYIVCNAAKLGRALGDIIEPEFFLTGRFQNFEQNCLSSKGKRTAQYASGCAAFWCEHASFQGAAIPLAASPMLAADAFDVDTPVLRLSSARLIGSWRAKCSYSFRCRQALTD